MRACLRPGRHWSSNPDPLYWPCVSCYFQTEGPAVACIGKRSQRHCLPMAFYFVELWGVWISTEEEGKLREKRERQKSIFRDMWVFKAHLVLWSTERLSQYPHWYGWGYTLPWSSRPGVQEPPAHSGLIEQFFDVCLTFQKGQLKKDYVACKEWNEYCGEKQVRHNT